VRRAAAIAVCAAAATLAACSAPSRPEPVQADLFANEADPIASVGDLGGIETRVWTVRAAQLERALGDVAAEPFLDDNTNAALASAGLAARVIPLDRLGSLRGSLREEAAAVEIWHGQKSLWTPLVASRRIESGRWVLDPVGLAPAVGERLAFEARGWTRPAGERGVVRIEARVASRVIDPDPSSPAARDVRVLGGTELAWDAEPGFAYLVYPTDPPGPLPGEPEPGAEGPPAIDLELAGSAVLASGRPGAVRVLVLIGRVPERYRLIRGADASGAGR